MMHPMKDKDPLTPWRDAYNKRKEAALQEFFQFLSFPSVSADPQYTPDVQACAQWLSNTLASLGFHTELWPTDNHPILFASSLEAGPNKPTLLLYNHYDVQPADPLDQWTTPPFQPSLRNGNVYARGAQDNKGQCFYVLEALRLWKQTHNTFPINIKLLIEGEEEVGSPGLTKILPQKQKELANDAVAIVDLAIPSPTQPAITLGTRGILTLEIAVTEANQDLHSGMVGGLVQNPIHVLCSLLAQLHDASGAVTVPGFYDNIIPLTDKEKTAIDFSFDENTFSSQFGCPPLGGESKFSPAERRSLRPTLEINGITGGYSGKGFKTVIPHTASAKISCRIVPNQNPSTIANAIVSYLKNLTPKGVQLSSNIFPGHGTALRTSPDHPTTQAFAQALSEIYQKPCLYTLEGASIPIAPTLATTSLNNNVVLLGLGLDSDAIHAPNEHFSTDRLEKGCLMIARTIELLEADDVEKL